MKRPLSILLFTALITALGFIACRKQDAKESVPQDRGLTVAAARAYFESQVKKIVKTEGANILPIGEPNWDSAYDKKLNLGDAVAVPLKMTSTHTLGAQVVQGDNYLLIYKGKDKSLQHEVITVIPATPHENIAKFNGTAIVRDWSGTILRGFNYKDGKYEPSTITIGSKRGAQTEGFAPCAEAATTVCFPYASGMGYYCFYDVPVSSCGSGSGGGPYPGGVPGGGGYPGGGPDPGSYPNPGGGPGGGGNSANIQFDKSIDTTTLNPCFKNILAKLTGLSAGKVAQIIAKFAGETPGYNWKMVTGKTDNGTNAQTKQTVINGTVETVFDADKAKYASDLHIARTILHESVHAYLVAYFKNEPLLARAEYAVLVEEWSKRKRPDANELHHDEMIRDFIKDIGNALEEYGKAQGYSMDSQFYQDMAWGGLNTARAFRNKWTADQERIIDVLVIEQDGVDGQGNPSQQKGKPGGC